MKEGRLFLSNEKRTTCQKRNANQQTQICHTCSFSYTDSANEIEQSDCVFEGGQMVLYKIWILHEYGDVDSATRYSAGNTSIFTRLLFLEVLVFTKFFLPQ